MSISIQKGINSLAPAKVISGSKRLKIRKYNKAIKEFESIE